MLWNNFVYVINSSDIKCVQKKNRLTNCRFTTISSPISNIYMNIWHKTEVQTVILRCLMGLYLNWFKSYDTKWKTHKNAKNAKITKNSTYDFFFIQNCTKTKKEKISLCVITFEPKKIQTHSAPKNDRLNFSFVEDTHIVGRKTNI